MKSFGWVFALPFVAVFTAYADPIPFQPISPVSTLGNDSTAWDQVGAAKYLDDRMDLWFEKAKKLRTGQGTAACVSCHTVVPYALARPLLRKASGMSKPTPQEARLLDETLRRVGTYDNHEPFYKGKDEQSCGTEAVLNLFVLAAEDSSQDRRVPNASTRKALEELWKQQRADGSWDWLDFGLEPYETTDSPYYGAALAAMAVGAVAGYADSSGESMSSGVDKLRSYLNANYAEQNFYNKAWMLLASTRLTGLLSRDQTDVLASDLQHKQNPDGGWSLYNLGPWRWSKVSPPFKPEGKPDFLLLSKSDAYATGLIAYALRQAGTRADHPGLKKATDWLETNQKEWQIDQSHWKCWRTYSLNYDREHEGDEGEPWRRMFMSDAATAFAVLALLPSN